MAPACSQERFGGTGMASLRSISPYSAKPPTQRPMTFSPLPDTSPAASCPAGLAAPRPPRNSPRFRLEAWIFTSSWLAEGCGVGTSRSSSCMPSPPDCRK
jgi:hypothetical protein